MLVACQDEVGADSNGENPIIGLLKFSRVGQIGRSEPTLHHENLNIETIEAAKCLHTRLANIVTRKVYCRGRHEVNGHPEIAYCQSSKLLLVIVETMVNEH